MEVSELSFGDTHLATSGVGVGGLTTAEHHPTSCSAGLAAPYSWPGFVPLGFPSVSLHSFPWDFLPTVGLEEAWTGAWGGPTSLLLCLCPQKSCQMSAGG